jgi:hypothetical protein
MNVFIGGYRHSTPETEIRKVVKDLLKPISTIDAFEFHPGFCFINVASDKVDLVIAALSGKPLSIFFGLNATLRAERIRDDFTAPSHIGLKQSATWKSLRDYGDKSRFFPT